MTPDDFKQLQYARVSTLGYDLVETGDEAYPYRVEKHGTIIRDKLRSVTDVAVWVDYQEDEEAAARARFE